MKTEKNNFKSSKSIRTFFLFFFLVYGGFCVLSFVFFPPNIISSKIIVGKCIEELAGLLTPFIMLLIPALVYNYFKKERMESGELLLVVLKFSAVLKLIAFLGSLYLAKK